MLEQEYYNEDKYDYEYRKELNMSDELAIKRDEETGLVVMDIPSEFEGIGSEQLGADDRTVPWFKILQGGSPEIKSANSRVEGAQPGMFYNSATGDLFSGDEGVEITICTTERKFVEYAPKDKGGGFIGKHEPGSPVVREAEAHSKLNDIWPIERPNKNRIVDTRYLYVLVGDCLEPAVMAISSSKLKNFKNSYKEKMSIYHRCRVKNSNGDKVKPPLCMIRFIVKSFDDVGKGEDFSNLKMFFAVDDNINKSIRSFDDPIVKLGIQVAEDFNNSNIQVDYAEERVDSDEVIDVKVFE